jgi:hypothetical protein
LRAGAPNVANLVVYGDHVKRLAGLALTQKPSVDFSGYWQRHEMKEAAN